MCGVCWHHWSLAALSTLFSTMPVLNSSPTCALPSSSSHLARRPEYDSMESEFHGLFPTSPLQTGSGPLSSSSHHQRPSCVSWASVGSSTCWMKSGSFRHTRSGLYHVIILQWSPSHEIFTITCPVLISYFSRATSTIASWLTIERGLLPHHSALLCAGFLPRHCVLFVLWSVTWW